MRFGSPRRGFPLATPFSAKAKGAAAAAPNNQRSEEAMRAYISPKTLPKHSRNSGGTFWNSYDLEVARCRVVAHDRFDNPIEEPWR